MNTPKCSVCGHGLILLPCNDNTEPLVCGRCGSAAIRKETAAKGIVRHPEWREDVPYCRKGTCPSWDEGKCVLDGRRVGYKNYNDSGITTCWPEIRWLRKKWLNYVHEGTYDLEDD
jgi:ribosomal protein S27AE